MTESPLLPPGRAERVAEHLAESEATDAELTRMTELALGRGAQAIAVGRGNSPAATRAAASFARRWEAAGGTVIRTVTWPESAASWLRQATRFAAADPDLWVMAPDLPGLVLSGAAGGAGAVAGREGSGLVGEEDTVPDVSAAGDRAQRRGAVEAAVDPLAPVAAPLPLHIRLIRPAVGAEQDVGHEKTITPPPPG
jgi:hypothetical protein